MKSVFFGCVFFLLQGYFQVADATDVVGVSYLNSKLSEKQNISQTVSRQRPPSRHEIDDCRRYLCREELSRTCRCPRRKRIIAIGK
jgi:hypothetical protein